MRDVILVRKGGPVKVKVSDPTFGHFATLYTPIISGIEVPVTRGWVAVEATATKGKGKKRRKASSSSSTPTSRRSTTRPRCRASARSRRRS